MSRVRAGEGLKQEWKIFRHMSFHDLVDLLAFGQLSFTGAHPRWHDGLLGGPSECTPRRPGDVVAVQSWSLLPPGGPPDWNETDLSRPHVCVVSSLGALAGALVAADVDVHIRRLADTRPSRLQVIACAAPRAGAAGSDHSLRLQVDLGTLLQGVAVSSGAPGRFMDLVARLVQANTPAQVMRAGVKAGSRLFSFRPSSGGPARRPAPRRA
ncbi:hypothetical protein [Bordetella sp. 2513F-2]